MIHREDILKILNTCLDSKAFLEELNSKGIPLSGKTEDGDTLLHVLFSAIIGYKHSEIANSLIFEKVVDINAVNKQGETCFDILVRSESCFISTLGGMLIRAGLQYNRENQAANSPLHSLFQYRPVSWRDLADQILEQDIDPNVLNDVGASYLDLLFKEHPYGWDVCALKLLRKKMNVEKTNSEQENDLMQLIRNGKYGWQKIALECIEQMRDFRAKNAQGKTALHMCIEFDHYGSNEVVGALIKKMEQQKIPTLPILIELSCSGLIQSDRFIELLKIALENGSDLYTLNMDGSLLISKIFNYDPEDYHIKYDRQSLIKTLFQTMNFDFCKTIQGQSVLQRLNLPNVRDDAIVKIIAEAILKTGNLARHELLEICRKNNIGISCIVHDTLSKDLEIMEPTFLAMEDSLIYGKETESNRGHRLNFDTKMLGHRFSLPGRVPSPVSEVAKEEGYVSLTGSMHLNTSYEICQSIQHFIEEFSTEMGKRHLRLFQKLYFYYRKAFRSRLIFDKYEFQNLRPKALELLLKECQEDIAVIHTGYLLHAVTLIIVKGSILYRCNKGGCNFGKDVVEKYKITRPGGLTAELLEKLMKEDSSEKNKSFIHRDIHEILGLELIAVIKGTLQTVGNCCWASKKTGARALIHHLDGELDALDELDEQHKIEKKEKSDSTKSAEPLFKALVHFDKRFYFQRYVEKYRDTPTFPYMLRRILCTHFDPKSEKDIAFGTKIIRILKTLPNFTEGTVEFLIKYWTLGQNVSTGEKEKEKQKQFSEFMRIFGIDLKDLPPECPPIAFLFKAVIDNDIKRVDEILRSGIKPEAYVYLGWTPLHIAVANDSTEMTELLIQFEPKWAKSKNTLSRSPLFYVKNVTVATRLMALGCSPDETVDHFETPLNSAALKGSLALVQCFVEAGATFNEETLHSAARSGCVETGAYLLKMDPKLLTTRDYDYYLPIHTAAELGHQGFVLLLLQHGSPTSTPDVNGNTPMHLAARYEKEPVLQMLTELPTCRLGAKNHQNKTLLAFSLHKSDRKWQQDIERAIQAQEQAMRHYESAFLPDRRMALLKTPEQTLYGAIRVGDFKAARGCLSKFPTLNINAIPDPFANDVLQEAVTLHRNDIFDLLIKIPSIDVNSKNGIEERPLHCAIASRNLYALKVLLAHPKVRVNEPEDMGYTALHYAAERGFTEGVQLLLSHPDIDSTIQSNNGERADEMVKTYFSFNEIKDLIQAHQRQLAITKAKASRAA